MAVTVESSGTQTATVTTEHTLHSPTGAKVYTMLVDTGNMVNGDIVELRVKAKVLSSGTVRLVYYAVFANLQDDFIKISVPITAPQGATFTLKQTAGTGRNFDWAVVSV